MELRANRWIYLSTMRGNIQQSSNVYQVRCYERKFSEDLEFNIWHTSLWDYHDGWHGWSFNTDHQHPVTFKRFCVVLLLLLLLLKNRGSWAPLLLRLYRLFSRLCLESKWRKHRSGSHGSGEQLMASTLPGTALFVQWYRCSEDFVKLDLFTLNFSTDETTDNFDDDDNGNDNNSDDDDTQWILIIYD